MFDIRLDGDTRRLLRQARRLSELDKRELNTVLGEVAHSSTIARFRDGKAPDGRRWLASNRADTTGGRTLLRSAQLRNSISVMSDESGFAVGTNLKYAATHQFGEPGRIIRARKKKALRFRIGGRWISKKQVRISIPARPFLGLSDEDMQEIKDTVEEFISREE